MSDRINAFVVILNESVREDEVNAITTALKMIKGVYTVTPHVESIEDLMAEIKANNTAKSKLLDIVSNWK